MNKIYKVIWSKVKCAFIVVSELAKSHTNEKRERISKSGKMAAALFSALFVAVTGLTFPVNVYAQGIIEVPEGWGTYIVGGTNNSMSLFRFYNEETGRYYFVEDFRVKDDGKGGFTFTSNGVTYSTADSTLEKIEVSSWSNILGGQSNYMGDGMSSSIVAGQDNMLQGNYNVIVGGWANTVGSDDEIISESVIIGGSANVINGDLSAIIGGTHNTILNKSSNPGVIVGAQDALSNAQYLGDGGTVIIGGRNGYAGYNNAISIAGGYAAKGIAIGTYASNDDENTISFGHKKGDKYLDTFTTGNVGEDGIITDEDGNIVTFDSNVRKVPDGHTYTYTRGDTVLKLHAGDSYVLDAIQKMESLYLHKTYEDEQTTRLTNISAGKDQTDAVNVSQLISKGSYNSGTKQLTLQSNSGSSVKVDLSGIVSGKTYTAGDGIIISSDVISVKKDGTVTNGNSGLVTGGTVYNAIKGKADITYVEAELVNKTDTDLGNITEDGKDVVEEIAKDALQEDLAGKANIDASNVGNYTSEWGAAIGTGAVEEGNGELVTGGTVYDAVKNKADISYVDSSLTNKADVTYVDEELLNKADIDLGNITAGGQTVIKNIAKDAVKLEDGLNTTVTKTENNDGSLTYQINVEGNGKAEAGNTGLVSGDTLYNTVNEITENITNVTEGINAELYNKANVDASNVAEHTSEWGAAIGTGKVEEGNGELVTGGTVYDAVKDKADIIYVDEQLAGKADADLGNITEDGKDVIQNIAQNSVKVEDGLNTTVSKTENDDGSLTYQVNVEGTGKAEAGNTGLISGDTLYNTVNEITENITNVTAGINAELDNKANADASNVGDHTAEWGAAIGTGKVEEGNGELVTGGTVYDAVKDKADTDLGNITEDGKEVIGDIAKDALQYDLDGKANIDASNIETDKWADKLGTGTVTDGDTNLVNGDAVYDAIKNMGGGLVMSDGKTITVGKDDGATVIDVSKNNGDGSTENRVITGVATDANDMSSAANVGYVNNSVNQMASEFNRGLSDLDSRMKKGVAGAAALAALNPLDYDPENKLNFAAGVGSYKGESATALGMFYRPNENVMFSLGGAFGNGENMWNAGITFNLDKPNKSTSRAVMAHAIKSMAADNEALEAKAAEQDAKIALLTAQVEELIKAQEN